MFESIESTRLSEALSGIRPPLPVISPFVPLRTRRYLVEHPIAFCAEEVHVGDQDVALWCCQTVNVDRRLLDYPGRLGFLSESELEGCRRFMFAHDRDMYVVARILVRTVLSLFESIEPSAWRFVTNAYGRPEIAPGSEPAYSRQPCFYWLARPVSCWQLCRCARH